jgi:hypothetical protein
LTARLGHDRYETTIVEGLTMFYSTRFLTVLGMALLVRLAVAEEAPPVVKLVLSSPQDFQVSQRRDLQHGPIDVAGSATFDAPTKLEDLALEAHFTGPTESGSLESPWQPLPFDKRVPGFRKAIELPAGGWYRLKVRLRSGEKELASTSIDHVGIGEVFIVAGQSNAANHGAEKTQTKSGRVAAFDGKAWAAANDPMPNASGNGGSFLPSFGDALAEKFNVPIGVVPVAVGATSVREWLPKGTTIVGLPPRTSNIETVGPQQWVSRGVLFDKLVKPLRQFGPHGVRAVLWHQGESDAHQSDAERTLSGKLYREYLEKVIRDSRREAGWEVPWLVAQVSYHSPDDTQSDDIRQAQKSLWDAKLAFEGPDTDTLTGDNRDRDGKGVHMSAKGLTAHGRMWAEKAAAVIDQMGSKSTGDPKPSNGRTN